MGRHGDLSIAATSAAHALKNKFNAIWIRLKPRTHKLKPMPTEVELCLLICTMFPDDSRIPIDDLVMYLMGLNFFEDVDDLFAARCKVNDLISSINKIKYPRNVRAIGEKKDEPQEQCLKLLVGARDLVNLMSLSCPLLFRFQTIQQKWPELYSYNDFYGLSLVLKKMKDYPIYLDCPKLALLQLQYGDDSGVIPVEFFKEMKELCILSLDIPSLPQSLDVPRNLTTLRIKVINLEDMSWIGGLTNLEFLSISTSSLTNIPVEMGNLEKLRLLNLKRMNLAYIPTGVLLRMLKLEELYLPLSFGRWGCNTRQLDGHDEWEFGEDDYGKKINSLTNEIDDGDKIKINASLDEIVSPFLKALHISIPNASCLPKKSPIFKNIRQFKIYEPNYVKYQPVEKEKDSSNELHLTGDAIDIRESGICDLMSRAEDLSLMRVKYLKNVTYFLENNNLPLLKKMIISECQELECIFDATSSTLSLRNLESLHLSMLYNLKEICNHRWQAFRWISNLSKFSIRFCHKLRYVFPISFFSRRILLKDIEILDCNELEAVFYEDDKANLPIMLGCIENLDLHSLPKLIAFSIPKDFINGDFNEPLTAKEIISSSNRSTSTSHDNIRSIALNESISTLKESRIDDEELLFPLSKNKAKLQLGDIKQPPSLQQVPFIKNKEDAFSPMKMFYLFSSQLEETGLQNLKRLKIAFCDSIVIIFLSDENHASSKAFISLKELELYGLRNLVHIWFQIPKKTSAFQNLQLLTLFECNNAYVFSYRVAKLLIQLQKVYVSRCEKMIEIIVKDFDERKGGVVLPGLKLLELQHIPNLVILFGGTYEIELPLLESLKLNQCNQIKSISNGLLKMPMLEGIQVNGSFHVLSKDHNTIFTGMPTLHRFKFAHLKIATKKFSSDNLLGEGGSAKVYKGWIDRKTYAPSKTGVGIPIAVKRFKKPDNPYTRRQSLSEVDILVGKLHLHPNLVKLLGHCSEEGEIILVYEFMQRGSLHYRLFTRDPGIKPLSWPMRIKIAIGAARGLNCLHTSTPQVIHRDIKPSNILLDNDYDSWIADFGLAISGPSNEDSHETIMNYNARISDFSLARLVPSDCTHISTTIEGTSGYIDPEYYYTGHVTVKSDVYSFGVVLLQLMTGLKMFDEKFPEEKRDWVTWLRPILSQEKELKNFMDSRMEGNYSYKDMMLIAELAYKCTEVDSIRRPSMEQVLQDLHKVVTTR